MGPKMQSGNVIMAATRSQGSGLMGVCWVRRHLLNMGFFNVREGNGPLTRWGEGYIQDRTCTHMADYEMFLATTVKLGPLESGPGSNPDSDACECGLGASHLPNVQFSCLYNGNRVVFILHVCLLHLIISLIFILPS